MTLKKHLIQHMDEFVNDIDNLCLFITRCGLKNGSYSYLIILLLHAQIWATVLPLDITHFRINYIKREKRKKY